MSILFDFSLDLELFEVSSHPKNGSSFLNDQQKNGKILIPSEDEISRISNSKFYIYIFDGIRYNKHLTNQTMKSDQMKTSVDSVDDKVEVGESDPVDTI